LFSDELSSIGARRSRLMGNILFRGVLVLFG
jgi:hypothetical protein